MGTMLPRAPLEKHRPNIERPWRISTRRLESKPIVLGLLKDLPDKLLEMDQNQYGLIT